MSATNQAAIGPALPPDYRNMPVRVSLETYKRIAAISVQERIRTGRVLDFAQVIAAATEHYSAYLGGDGVSSLLVGGASPVDPPACAPLQGVVAMLNDFTDMELSQLHTDLCRAHKSIYDQAKQYDTFDLEYQELGKKMDAIFGAAAVVLAELYARPPEGSEEL
jgi:hypothetical protein